MNSKVINPFLERKEALKHLSDKKKLLTLLNDLEFYNYKIIRAERKYKIDNDRHGLILQVRNEDNGQLERIIIDQRFEEPSSQQVFDVVYGLGEDCDKRIVIFSKAYKKNCFNEDQQSGFYEDALCYSYECEFIVEDLTKILNDYGREIYLVKAEWQYGKRGYQHKFIPLNIPEREPKHVDSEIISKRKLEEALFWVVDYDYNLPSGSSPACFWEPNDWLGYQETIFGEDAGECTSKWTDEGLFLIASPGNDHQTLKWLYENKKDEIEAFLNKYQFDLEFEKDILQYYHQYKNHLMSHREFQINLDLKSEEGEGLMVKILNIPFAEIIKYPSEEKQFYAVQNIYILRHFLGLIEELIEKMNSEIEKETV